MPHGVVPDTQRDYTRNFIAMNYRKISFIAAAVAFSGGHALADITSVVTFDSGAEGWVGGNGTFINTESTGNRHLQSVDETFGVHYSNSQNDSFLGDYTAHESITLSVDVRIDKIDTTNLPEGFASVPQTRSLVMELQNTDYASGSIFDHSAVILVLDNQLSSANNREWETFSVTFDPNQVELPAGWIGFGGSDDADGPVLPTGVTFADILSNVDKVVFSTFVPTEFYLQVFFDFSVDNFTITRTDPAASCLADLNGDGTLDFFDISAFLSAFGSGDLAADFIGDGVFDFFDISAFLGEFAAGCP